MRFLNRRLVRQLNSMIDNYDEKVPAVCNVSNTWAFLVSTAFKFGVAARRSRQDRIFPQSNGSNAKYSHRFTSIAASLRQIRWWWWGHLAMCTKIRAVRGESKLTQNSIMSRSRHCLKRNSSRLSYDQCSKKSRTPAKLSPLLPPIRSIKLKNERSLVEQEVLDVLWQSCWRRLTDVSD